MVKFRNMFFKLKIVKYANICTINFRYCFRGVVKLISSLLSNKSNCPQKTSRCNNLQALHQ